MSNNWMRLRPMSAALAMTLGIGLVASSTLDAGPTVRNRSRPRTAANAQQGQAAANAQSSGASGGFQGVININGQEYRSNDPAEFARLQQQLRPQLQNPLLGLPALPNGIPTASVGSSGFQGAININGQEYRTNDPAEFARLQQQLGQQLTNPAIGLLGAVPAGVASSSGFQGVVNINGQEYRTNDPAEFARLQQQLGLQFRNTALGLPMLPNGVGTGGFSGGSAGGFSGGSAGGFSGGSSSGSGTSGGFSGGSSSGTSGGSTSTGARLSN